MKGVLTAALAATALAVAACSEQHGAGRPLGLAAAVDSLPPPPPPGDSVATVEVTPSADTVAAGDSASFFATLRDANGNVLSGRTVSWTVSDSSVARIEGAFGQTVIVRAVGAGFALVTASSEGRSGSGSILVP